MAHVREVPRKAGTAYEVRWKVNGSFKQRTFTVKREAERFALKVENEIADGASTDALVKNSKTFQQVAEAMQDARAHKNKPKTRRGDASIYRLHVYPTFGQRRISSITSIDVEQWMAEMQTKVSPLTHKVYSASSVRSQFVALSKVFKYALQHRLISVNPCGAVDRPKIEHREMVFLSPEQVAAVAERLDATPPYGLLVRFAAYTGLRAGELEGLRIRDINFLRRHVEVRRQAQRTPGVGWEFLTPKSARSCRDVPLTRSLLTELRGHIEAHPYRTDPDALLWPGRKRGGYGATRAPFSYDVQFHHASLYENHFKPALVELGIPVVRWHDLRHFYASACAAQGIDIRKVSRWMGHANINVTDGKYTHLFNGSATEDMDRLDALASATIRAVIPRIGNG